MNRKLMSLLFGFLLNEATDGTGDTTGGAPAPTPSGEEEQVFAPQQRSELFDVDDEDEDLDADPSTDKTLLEGDPDTADDKKDGEEGKQQDDKGTDKSDDSDFIYNDQKVQVEDDPAVTATLKEKGFDINDLNKEFYSKEGLKAETRTKLEEAFGKPTVDLYISSLKAKNDATLAQAKASAESFETRRSAMADKATQGKLQETLKWANDNLKPDEYKRYAAVVNGENMDAAQLGLEMLFSKYQATLQQGQQKGTGRPNLPTDGSTHVGGQDPSMAGLSEAEYMELFTPTSDFPRGKYFSNPKQFDRLRDLGRRNGR